LGDWGNKGRHLRTSGAGKAFDPSLSGPGSSPRKGRKGLRASSAEKKGGLREGKKNERGRVLWEKAMVEGKVRDLLAKSTR